MKMVACFVLSLGMALFGASHRAVGQSKALEYWSDGKAELAGYALTQPRYGESRSGTVVLIFVKEPFSESARVKADPGRHPPSDVFPVMKLNVAKDFQTGIYDYNLMTSAFVSMRSKVQRGSGGLTKLVFSSQEWCGALFEELLFDRDKVRQRRFSYFDGEGDQIRTLSYPKASIAVDQLPILVRRLPQEMLKPGERRTVQFLPSLERARLTHKPLEWKEGLLSRAAAEASLTVLGGSFKVNRWVADLGSGERYEYAVEAAFPHRIIQWTGPEGEKAQFLGSERLAYWSLNREGHEKFLGRLGLPLKKSAH